MCPMTRVCFSEEERKAKEKTRRRTRKENYKCTDIPGTLNCKGKTVPISLEAKSEFKNAVNVINKIGI